MLTCFLIQIEKQTDGQAKRQTDRQVNELKHFLIFVGGGGGGGEGLWIWGRR